MLFRRERPTAPLPRFAEGNQECGLVAQHEHIPEMAAVELGNYLVHTPEGERRIKAMIVDDIDEARRGGRIERVLTLKLCLKHYLEQHGGKKKNEG